MTVRIIILIFISLVLSACSHSVVRDNPDPIMSIDIKASREIHLAKVKENQKTVYVQVRNQTTDDDFKLEQQLKRSLRQAGYLLVTVPDKAHFLLEVTILAVTQNDLKQMHSLYEEGYGESIDRNALNNIDPEKAEKEAKAWFNQKQPYAALIDVRISELSKTAVLEGARVSDQNAIRAYFNNVSHWTRHTMRVLAATEAMDNYFIAREELIKKMNQRLMDPFMYD